MTRKTNRNNKLMTRIPLSWKKTNMKGRTTRKWRRLRVRRGTRTRNRGERSGLTRRESGLRITMSTGG